MVCSTEGAGLVSVSQRRVPGVVLALVVGAQVPAPIAAYSGLAGPGTMAVPDRTVCGQYPMPLLIAVSDRGAEFSEIPLSG
jgi:hypothetical protein